MTKLLTDKPINTYPDRQGIAAGDFISSADMNACLDAMGERTNYLYTMGIYPHNTAFAYPIGAFCQVSGVVYRATVANTGKPPASNPSIWTACPMTAAEISAALNFVTALNGKQDADNTLTALANLATSADKMIYATGADQFALTPLTAFIRSLLDDADAASARATLGAAADNHGHATSQITGLDGALGDRYTKAEANNLLAAKINKAGDTMTGQLTFKGGTLEAGGGFNSAADNDSGMDFPADGHVRLRSNARVAVEALPDGTVITRYGGNRIACQPDGHMVVYDTHGAAKHVFRGNGSYTATDNIESQANIYGREVIAKQTAIICNRNNESQQWHIFSDNDRDLKFYSTVAGDTVGYINREGKIYTTGYGWLHDKFVAKAGDTMSGSLTTRYTSDWVGFSADNPTEGKGTFFDGQVAGIPRGGMQIKPAAGGNGEYFTTIAATPAGATNADRRVGGLDVYATGLFANAYGWLHDYFMRRSDCVTNWYPSHYAGAHTFKIRNLNLMITTMGVHGLGADTTLNLPEAYTGVAHAFASDAGEGKHNMGAHAVNGTQVRVYAGPATSANILLIGYKDNI